MSAILEAQLAEAVTHNDWAAAVRCAEAAEQGKPPSRTLRFARNMVTLHERHPVLARAVERENDSGRIGFFLRDDNSIGISIVLREGSSPHDLSCNAMGPQQISAMFAQQKQPHGPIATIGVGDGAALQWLSEEAPDTLGQTRAVTVIEPSVELFRAALMINDWHTEGSPLCDDRFDFCVGPDCLKQLLDRVKQDASTPPPGMVAQLRSVTNDELDAIAKAIPTCHQGFTAIANDLSAEATKPGFARSTHEIAESLEARSARIMILTTQFSTVLQYSARDFAKGFRSLGFDVHLVIEDEPWHRHTRRSVLEQLVAIRPHLVLQIDHHRNAETVPAHIPFACIIQDNLPHLTRQEAGNAMGPTDFAVGPWVHRYILNFAYPPSQCIETHRMAHEPAVPAHVSSRTRSRPSMLYVSNHSMTFDASLNKLLHMFPAGPWRDFAGACAQKIYETYKQGGCIEDGKEVTYLVEHHARECGLDPKARDKLAPIAESLAVVVNNPLYRQQGLAWAAAVAQAQDIDLIIHGAGWEDHPHFAPWAAGTIDYGPALVEATRNATCCLMLEPFFSTSHQRSIDVWMAGGLVLIRKRARDVQTMRFLAWLDRLAEGIDSYDAALGRLKEPGRSAFRQVYAAQQALNPDVDLDLIAINAERRRNGMGDLMRQPPHYDCVAFADEIELGERITALCANPEERKMMAREQHDWVRARFSYQAGAERIADHIAKALRP